MLRQLCATFQLDKLTETNLELDTSAAVH